MDMYSINTILNEILKDRSKNDIVKDFESIKNLCKSVLENKLDHSNININDRNNLTDSLLKQIIIKGETFEYLERKFNERNNYKKLNEILNELNFSQRKTVTINIDGINYDIDVFDTGFSYIPIEKHIFSQKLLDELNNLWQQDKIEKIADIIENGPASIHLDFETREKVNEELEKRKKLKENKYNSFTLKENNYLDSKDDLFFKQTNPQGESYTDEPIKRI